MNFDVALGFSGNGNLEDRLLFIFTFRTRGMFSCCIRDRDFYKLPGIFVENFLPNFFQTDFSFSNYTICQVPCRAVSLDRSAVMLRGKPRIGWGWDVTRNSGIFGSR
jgi:hypothetical protein